MNGLFGATGRKILYIVSAVVAALIAVTQAYFTGSGTEQPGAITGVLAALAALGALINTLAAANAHDRRTPVDNN